jgi:hypothetical protein
MKLVLNLRKLLKTWSGRRDLNSGPLAPQASALARLRHGPKCLLYTPSISLSSDIIFG